jgi:hypothetical protein
MSINIVGRHKRAGVTRRIDAIRRPVQPLSAMARLGRDIFFDKPEQ